VSRNNSLHSTPGTVVGPRASGVRTGLVGSLRNLAAWNAFGVLRVWLSARFAVVERVVWIGARPDAQPEHCERTDPVRTSSTPGGDR
jgi:hypothetical protein